jgi:uncharacterized protein YkwD
MGKLVLLFLFVGALAGGFIFWQNYFGGGQLGNWGYLYNSTTEEKQLAEAVSELTNVWRRERVLPELRTEETLCAHADRYVREVAKTAGNRDAFQRMVQENTIVLQVSYDKVVETAGYATTAQDLIQAWADNSADREVLQDKTLTHRCVRCHQRYCAQIFIHQL